MTDEFKVYFLSCDLDDNKFRFFKLRYATVTNLTDNPQW